MAGAVWQASAGAAANQAAERASGCGVLRSLADAAPNDKKEEDSAWRW